MTPATDYDLHKILLILVKRRWMILLMLVVAICLTVLYNFVKKPVYSANTTLLVERNHYTVLPEVVSNDHQADEFYDTQFNLLMSEAIAGAVADRLNLTKAFPRPDGMSAVEKNAGDSRDEVIQRLLEDVIEVRRLKNTSIFSIYAKTPTARLSMDIANAWAEEYINFSLKSYSDYAEVTQELMSERIAKLQVEIAEKEKALGAISMKEQVVRLDNDRSIHSLSLEQINAAYQSAKQERIAQEVRNQNLRQTGPDAIPEIQNHPTVVHLEEEQKSLLAEYSEKSVLYKSDYPELIRIQKRIDQTRENLKSLKKDLYAQILSSAGASYQQALNKETELESALTGVRGQLITAGGKEVDYQQLKLELDSKRSLLDSLLKTAGETGLSKEAKDRKLTTIRIVDRARIPTAIYEPKPVRNLFFATFVTLFLSICAAFLLENLDRSYSGSAEVQQHLNLPVLGIVPSYHSSSHSRKSLPWSRPSGMAEDHSKDKQYAVTFFDPQSPVSEAFAAIRTSFLLSFPSSPPSTTVVTSTTQGEGKTFVACNFAISMAQINKRVLLIDADMRNPRLQKIWNNKNGHGLSKFLTSNMRASDIIFPSSISHLSIVTSGPCAPRPAELLASQRWDDLLKEINGQFDHIVIDSPPLIPVADPVILISKAESVLVVIRGGVTSRDLVEMAMQKLLHNESKIAGVILNDVDLSGSYYYLRYRNLTYKNGSSDIEI